MLYPKMVHLILFAALLTGLGSVLAACQKDPVITAMPDAGSDPIKINLTPTGSIQTPSLCERLGVDQRVTTTGASSFGFLWAAGHYQVVFSDVMNGDIYSVQLDRNGVPKAAPERVEATPGASALPVLLQTKTGFLVAWQDDVNVRLHALDPAGHPVGSGHNVAAGRSSQTRPVLSASPMGTAIAWMNQTVDSSNMLDDVGDSETNIALVADDLTLRTDIPQKRITQSEGAGYPWLAGDADELSVLWSETINSRTDTVVSTVSAQLGIPLKTPTRDAGALNAALLGRLLKTDFGYVASWEDHRSGQAEIYMSLLDPQGNVYAGGLVEEPNTGNANWSHMAWTGSAAAIVYYQYRAGKPQIFLTFIDSHGKRIGGAADMQFSNTTLQARFPDVVWNGDEFGGIWIDARDGQTEMYFNRATCKTPAPI